LRERAGKGSRLRLPLVVQPDHLASRAGRRGKKTGTFPDGTVMIKELTSVGSKDAPSGKGYFRLMTVDGEGKLTARMERLPYRQELDTGR